MEPVSLALGVIAVFKDAYLTGKFVYTIIGSALKSAEERNEIGRQLRHELLFFQSFGSWFISSRGKVTNDPALNKAWLHEMRDTLESLKTDLAEYRDLAEKVDDQYRKYSPTINPAFESSGVIEFELNQELPPISEPTLLGQFGKLFSKRAVKDVYVSGEWALFRKKKLDKLITKFQKRNKVLRHILQVAIPSQIQAVNISGNINEKWLGSHHPDRLGLRGHFQIARIQQTSHYDAEDLEIKGCQLHCEEQLKDSVINQGKLRIEKAKNNVLEKRVLVEYKKYPSIPGNRNSLDSTGEDDEHPKQNRPNQIAKLAALLHSAGTHNLGTLPFRGFVDQAHEQRYAFLFEYPEGTSQKHYPQTLNSIISPGPDAGQSKPWSLAQRFHCACKLANILEAFNNDGWVHKSIRSHSVAFLHDKQSGQLVIHNPYLINFEYSRLHYNTTYLERDEDSEKDLYRHPALQVSNRQDSFTSVHDIYALGVVLLEIAIWKSASQIIEEYAAERPQNASEVRRLYVKIANLEVPWLMGDAFLKAILACLTDEFEDDFLMSDRGTFHKKVVENLSPKALQVEE